MKALRATGRKLLLAWTALAALASCAPGKKMDDPELSALLRSSGAEETGEDKTVLTLWSFHQAKEFEFWQWLGERYEAEFPDIDIKVEYISSDIYFSGTRLLAPFASGHGPDVFFVSSATIRRFADASLLYPLTGRLAPDVRADFDPAALLSASLDGELLAIPFETELLGLYYNKNMFAKAGLAPPRTWEETKAAAEALTTKGTSGLTIETFGNVYQNFSWLPFLWQTGADVLSGDGRSSGFDEDGALRTYSYFSDLRSRGLLNMNPSRPTTDIAIIANGETAMQVSGSWNVRLLETEYADAPIGVVPLPYPEGGARTTIAGGWKIAANRAGAHADEAAKFILWAFAGDPDIPLKWSSEAKFAYSPRRSVMEAGERFYNQGLRAEFTKRIFGTERQEPQYPERINQIYSESLQRLLKGDEEASVIVRDTHRRLEEALR
ncbi:sugar ABC transporter substrate-binding protein [Paenibacillus antri]|uniref:Sugar ABC transporter substrate-binding protein n=1 Tax=Paenibacillus antri TaxID=2582848 RepID=A0A5R9G5Z5_9BACL|nr:sugar ABC transporter substrate-binding protein [Paenibacillus antri]TLS49530.1 sugar ABC transporter substrate-binding protein [Paenibacillus antri]